MREKGKQHGFSAGFGCSINKPSDDLLVTEMHAIKGSGGDNRVFYGNKGGDIVVNFHAAKVVITNYKSRFQAGLPFTGLILLLTGDGRSSSARRSLS